MIRSTFVIDGDGVIRVARIHPRYSNHERFLGILVQAGSHGGAHRAAKAAELVYCDVFDRDAQHVGKDKTSSPRCALSSSRLCMADSRTCTEASQLCHKSSLNLFPTMIAAKRTPTWPQSQNLHIEKTRRMIRAVIRNRNIILFLSCNNNHCYWDSSPVPYIAYVDDHAVGVADLPVFPPYHPSDSRITVHTGIRERK